MREYFACESCFYSVPWSEVKSNSSTEYACKQCKHVTKVSDEFRYESWVRPRLNWGAVAAVVVAALAALAALAIWFKRGGTP